MISNLLNYTNTFSNIDSSLDFHIVPCFDFSTLSFKISWGNTKLFLTSVDFFRALAFGNAARMMAAFLVVEIIETEL